MKSRHLIILILLSMAFVSGIVYLYNRSTKSLSLVSPASDKIFTLPPPSATAAPSPTPTPVPVVTIGLVGDLGLGRYITSTARSKKDFSWSFRYVSSWLQQNDFNIANLESPIIPDCPEGKTGTFTFCGDERFLPYLLENKFVFSLANNHILNYGRQGYRQTKEFLAQTGLAYYHSQFEDDPFYKKEQNGITFGFLSFDFVTYPNYDQKKVIDLVTQYDPQVDWLIVSLHWGNEYKPEPEAWRVKFAHELVDAGADIIHGQHPHVWQPPEIYKDKLVYYSFGNFIFDQSWSYETSHTNIVRLKLSKTSVLDSQTFPVEIKYNSQPWLMEN